MTETQSPQLPNDQVWFITGASSGFGRLLAEEVLLRGGRVIATARSLCKVIDLEEKNPGRAKAYALDVTDPAQIASVVPQASACFAPVDILVNNAGYGLVGAIEEASEEEFLPVFDTNVFGLIRLTRALLPRMRDRGTGTIINISSVGGLIGSAGWGYYNASKFAVEGFSEVLAGELAPLGLRVLVVEPGRFRTDFFVHSGKQASERIAAYDITAGKAREFFDTDAGKEPGDPKRAVDAILVVATSPNPPRHPLLGATALQRFRKHIADWSDELSRWESTTIGADFPSSEIAHTDFSAQPQPAQAGTQ